MGSHSLSPELLRRHGEQPEQDFRLAQGQEFDQIRRPCNRGLRHVAVHSGYVCSLKAIKTTAFIQIYAFQQL